MTVEIADLTKIYDDGTIAVARLCLDVRDGEFLSLLGPSGCGKTTTLRLIAGLEEPSVGTIRINGHDVTDRDPGDRDVAMVFQNYALYPHMSVYENLTLNLRVARVPRADIVVRAKETARLLGIESLLNKRPGWLSGGQRQRVALGRAIIRRPAAFLMDEPLSNLDVKLREQMRTEIKQLHRRLAVTTLYVTHDQVEAMTMSDRIAVMTGGEVQQVATPGEIYNHPANLFVAEFIGSPSINVFLVKDWDRAEHILPPVAPALAIPPSDLVFGLRPENVLLVPPEDTVLRGTIDFVEPVGPVSYAFIRIDSDALALHQRDRLIVTADAQQRLPVGSPVGLRFRAARLHAFQPDGRAVAGAFRPWREPASADQESPRANRSMTQWTE
jgi:sn-glycerol 3-phosphate transport system ATP-binding protein